MKTVTIIRGVSGSGKSTFGAYIASLNTKQDTIICCADDYFNTEDGYKFDVTKLNQAHSWCRDRFDESINKCANIIVNNTSTSENEFKYYIERAKENSYMVFVIVMEKWHNNDNIHGVPSDTLKHQERKLRGSFKPS